MANANEIKENIENVRSFYAENPGAKRDLCIKKTGLSYKTVYSIIKKLKIEMVAEGMTERECYDIFRYQKEDMVKNAKNLELARKYFSSSENKTLKSFSRDHNLSWFAARKAVNSLISESLESGEPMDVINEKYPIIKKFQQKQKDNSASKTKKTVKGRLQLVASKLSESCIFEDMGWGDYDMMYDVRGFCRDGITT